MGVTDIGKKLSRILLASTILVLLSMILVHPGFLVEPHDADSMWIEPSSVLLDATNPAHTVGYRFNITVYLNVTSDDVFQYQVALLYNRTQLKAIRAAFTAPPTSEFMQGHATTALINVDQSFLGNGSVLASEALSGTDKISPPRVGSLIWVEFEVLMAPEEGKMLTSKFDISSKFPMDTWVWSPLGADLLDVAYDGVYTFTSGVIPKHTLTITSTVGGTTDPSPGSYEYPEDTVVTVSALPDLGYLLDHWELDGSDAGSAGSIDVTMDADHALHAIFIKPVGPRIFVDPDEIIDPEMVPCTTFTINITVDDVEDMLICEFNLTYNTEILSRVNVTILEVQGQSPTAQTSFDDEGGSIWLNLTYSTPITVGIPTALATVEFHIEALGASSLDLHDTELIDSAGEPISHEAQDGFFGTIMRDVAIIDVVPSSHIVYQSRPLRINVTVRNEGDVNETFSVQAYYNSTLIGNVTIEDLPPNNQTTKTFTWNTSSVEPCHNYTMSGEASAVPYEVDTSDNVYVNGEVSVRHMGDTDGDGKVDFRDFFLVVQAFGSYPAHLRWDSDVDMNQDDQIDGRDIFVVATNFGKSCST